MKFSALWAKHRCRGDVHCALQGTSIMPFVGAAPDRLPAPLVIKAGDDRV